MRSRKYYLELFDMTYIYCLDWPQEKFAKWYRRRYEESPLLISDHAATIFEDEHSEIIIWTDSNSARNLNHECIHAASYTLDAIGHEPSFSNDEVQAYLIELIHEKAKGG